jgi:hypothetical protein
MLAQTRCLSSTNSSFVVFTVTFQKNLNTVSVWELRSPLGSLPYLTRISIESDDVANGVGLIA